MVWSMSVHIGSVCAHRKCLCVVGHICALETSGHFGRGQVCALYSEGVCYAMLVNLLCTY